MILKSGYNFDYADGVYHLKNISDLDDEEAFYFYEMCEDNGDFSECNSYDDVIDVLTRRNEERSKTIRKTRQVVIDQIYSMCSALSGCRVLEPSAGEGDLVDGILEKTPSIGYVHCVELNKEKREILKSKGYDVVGEDFLKCKPEEIGLYDVILACPTYKNNIDIEHIMHMYEFLDKGGYIVSLTSPYWTVRNDEHQVRFRKWLENKNYSMKMLSDNSFIENYKTQPSAMIKIYKQ